MRKSAGKVEQILMFLCKFWTNEELGDIYEETRDLNKIQKVIK